MLPPGVQQLVDSLPSPDAMERTAQWMQEGGLQVTEPYSGNAPNDEQVESVANFLNLLAQLIKQQGLYQQAELEQTEQLKLECPECHLTFAVDNALSYRRRVQEGYLCACANGHEPVVIGSGRLGEKTPDEQLTLEHPNLVVKVIYGGSDESDDSGN